MFHSGQEKVHFLRFLLQRFSQPKKQDLEKIIIASFSIVIDVLDTADCLIQMSVLGAFQLANIGYQHLFVKEFVQHQGKTVLYLFTVNHQKCMNQV